MHIGEDHKSPRFFRGDFSTEGSRSCAAREEENEKKKIFHRNKKDKSEVPGFARDLKGLDFLNTLYK